MSNSIVLKKKSISNVLLYKMKSERIVFCLDRNLMQWFYMAAVDEITVIVLVL